MDKRNKPGNPHAAGNPILEFHQIGDVVKVSAVDPVTLTEVSITGPAGAGRAVLQRVAIRKLRYVLDRANTANPLLQITTNAGT